MIGDRINSKKMLHLINVLKHFNCHNNLKKVISGIVQTVRITSLQQNNCTYTKLHKF